jgi:hypothetical protein
MEHNNDNAEKTAKTDVEEFSWNGSKPMMMVTGARVNSAWYRKICTKTKSRGGLVEISCHLYLCDWNVIARYYTITPQNATRLVTARLNGIYIKIYQQQQDANKKDVPSPKPSHRRR